MEENRITIEAGKRSGQPWICGLRITVWDVLTWLAAGMSEEQIITDSPELEKEDFRAVSTRPRRLADESLCETAAPTTRRCWIGATPVLRPSLSHRGERAAQSRKNDVRSLAGFGTVLRLPTALARRQSKVVRDLIRVSVR